MRNNNVHCKDFKPGDVVYVPETVYLNQKHERYGHEPWERIEMIRVKITRTVFKGITNDPYRPFNTTGGVHFMQIFGTFSEAVDCLGLHPYIQDKLKMQGAASFLNTRLNINKPVILELLVDAGEMEMMR